MGSLLHFILEQESFRRARLPSLYSDFSTQRYSNPDGFATNVAAWTDVLCKAASAGVLPAEDGQANERLSIHVGQPLLKSLETKEYGRPLAIGTAIDESQKTGRLIPYNDFLSYSNTAYKAAPASNARRLFSWGLEQLGLDTNKYFGNSQSNNNLPSGHFVITRFVESKDAASTLSSQLSHSESFADRIYSMSMFKEKVEAAISSGTPLAESDLKILLTYLARDKGMIAFDDEMVKVKAPGEKRVGISDEDKAVASLKTLMSRLDDQITQLSKRMEEARVKAQQAVSDKNRTLALSTLKSRKMTEIALQQRLDTRYQLQEIYDKIEQAADQVAVIQVMQGSTKVLHGLHTEIGGIEKVEDVIGGLKEETAKVDEVSQALEFAGQSNVDIDEDAIDEDLEHLMQQAKEKEEGEAAQRTEQRFAEVPAIKQTPPDAAREDDPKEGNLEPSSQSTEGKHDTVEAAMEGFEKLSLNENALARNPVGNPKSPMSENLVNG